MTLIFCIVLRLVPDGGGLVMAVCHSCELQAATPLSRCGCFGIAGWGQVLCIERLLNFNDEPVVRRPDLSGCRTIQWVNSRDLRGGDRSLYSQ